MFFLCKKIKTDVKHCVKVRGCICRTLFESKVGESAYVKHCMKVKYANVHFENCLKVKCAGAYVEHYESKVRKRACRTLYESKVKCASNTV